MQMDSSLTTGGDVNVQGSDVYDNSGHLRMSGEDNVYIAMDYNNNDGNTRAIMFGRNAFGGNSGWVELMRINENGNVGIGTTGPSEDLHVYRPDSDIARIWRDSRLYTFGEGSNEIQRNIIARQLGLGQKQ